MARLCSLAVMLAVCVLGVTVDGEGTTEEEVATLRESLSQLYKQMRMSQLYQEELLRSTGDSGIKQVRVGQTGDRPYHAFDHGGHAFMAMHNHDNYINTLGLGEFIAVLNGVEFRTRHNDYKFVMASRTSDEDRATEPIPLPEVPPAVLEKETVEEQIIEMRKWFKAFEEYDTWPRDFRPYFPASVCYLEGAWTHSGELAEDPFKSDRHSIGHTTWEDLIDNVEYAAFSGSKDVKENIAFLPTKIWGMNGSEPIIVQWNYRILCEPIPNGVPKRDLRPIDDLASRMRFQRPTWEDHVKSRAARFEYNWWSNDYPSDHYCYYCMTEKLMDLVPGRDNYQGNLTDLSFDQTALHFKTKEILNAAFYNRRYQTSTKGAMGSKTRTRGFSDGNLFMAQTTQPKIAAMTNTVCDKDGGNCEEYTSRWTYAIPLEIVYSTPLLAWNPYNIVYKGAEKNDEFRSVFADGRNGGLTPDKAYNGTNAHKYFITPAEFFEDTDGGGSDAADTSAGVVGVLDAEGNVRQVVASGHKILTSSIPEVGSVRTRFPIAPLHNDGNQIFKELEALKDVVTKMNEYKHMLRETPEFACGNESSPANVRGQFEMTVTTQDPPGPHTHLLSLSAGQMERLMADETETAEVATSFAMGHEHHLFIRYQADEDKPWRIDTCDGANTCADGHLMYINQITY